MKRLLLTVALCVAASGAFAQKKAVNQAQSIAKGDNANYQEARDLIKGALTDPESKDDAKTWYVAGFIEDQQFSSERIKQILGQTPDEPVMYGALINIFPYFEKAYELDQLPNEKGKVKPRFVKDIKNILNTNHVYYINGGAYYFDERDYKKAYDFFNEYIKIADSPIMVGEPAAQRDSNYLTVQYYAAIASTQLNEPQTAIATLERAIKTDYKVNELYQYLFEEYRMQEDTTNMVRVLKEAMTKVSEESFFMLNLINIQIYSGQNEEAIQYLNEAVQKDPNNPQLYDVIGRVYESGLQDFDKAEEYYKKALALDPDYNDSLSNLGRVYYNQAVNKLGDANMLSDAKMYQEESAKAKELFKQALPYFEKVHAADPESREAMTALRSIYYNLNMNDEFDAMEAKMNN
ncbi:MAG: tetratricopeptide repeat protein [Tannerellaceae bacterium]|nr:tetratricopeptide repeat protein [Tannerellaceae bacterium]